MIIATPCQIVTAATSCAYTGAYEQNTTFISHDIDKYLMKLHLQKIDFQLLLSS